MPFEENFIVYYLSLFNLIIHMDMPLDEDI